MKTNENTPTETTTTAKVTLGLDLGDRQHSYCVLDAEGEILAEDQIVNTRACLEQLSQRFPAATIAMETGTHCSPRCPQAGTRSPHPALRFGPRLTA